LWLLIAVLLVVQLPISNQALALGSTATGWSTDNYHIYLDDTSTGESNVAYCYSTGSISRPPANGTSYSLAGEINNATVRALVYNGCPIDGGGLMDKFGLTEERFRYITQRAVWTYLGDAALYNGWFGGLDSQAEEDCYNLLRGNKSSVSYNGETITLATPPASFVVKLYQNNYYQKLIVGLWDNEPDVPEEYPVYFSKQDAAGNELAGATVELRKADGTVVDTWTSDGSVHTFQVETGSYTLVETAAPSGYELATAITFAVDETGKVTVGETEVTSNAPIVMVDDLTPTTPENYPVYFSKQDADGKELAGATVELRKADGTVVDTWTSDGNTHTFQVQTGTYQLVETAAPEGYALATAITFVVDETGKVTVNNVEVTSDAPIVMVDEIDTPTPHDNPKYPVSFSKQDGAGNELAGATIELRDADGTVLETWTSDGTTHTFQVQTGTYQLVETAAPEGYELATAISFTVDTDGKVTVNGIEQASDAPIVMVDDLQDYPVHFSKQDAAGNELAGATIELRDADGKVLETWTSDGTTRTLEVKPGTYQFVETAAPEGYELATIISFTVDTDGKVTVNGIEQASDAPIVMVDDLQDHPVHFSKQDADGKELAGATIELQQEDGTVLDRWTSDGTTRILEVKPGTYKFVETAAPYGYELATAITFTVDKSGKVTVGDTEVASNAPIVMVDDLSPAKTYPVNFSKQDAAGNELPGATIQLQTAEGELVEEWLSDGTVHKFEVTAGEYQLVETAAPEGYGLATTIRFTVDETGKITVNGVEQASDAPIVMVDNLKTYPVYFSKRDAAGNELPGATVELRKADGTVVETWISDGTTHSFNVETGTYTLVETAAPFGYQLATTITFTVDKSGKVTANGAEVTADAPIVMVDNLKTYPAYFSKRDAAGNELRGATVELRKEDGTVVETWVSNGTTHTFNVEVGTYTLVETAAPSGYRLASNITFVVDRTGKVTVNNVEVTSDAPIVMVDRLDTPDTPRTPPETPTPTPPPETPDTPTPRTPETPEVPETPVVDVPEEDVPLAATPEEVPEQPEETVELPEEDVPQAAQPDIVPYTGDSTNLGLWIVLLAISAAGLLCVLDWFLYERKRS
jgi:uncharacterized surface anchored protein